MPTAPDLSALIDAIRVDPNDGPRWLAPVSWLSDNGQYDQTAAVRVFWPVRRENVAESRVSLDEPIRPLGRHAKLLGQRAREVEERAEGRAAD